MEVSADGRELALAGARFHDASSSENDAVQAAECRDGHENRNDPFQPRVDFHSETLPCNK